MYEENINNAAAEGAENALSAHIVEEDTNAKDKNNAADGKSGTYVHKFKNPFEYEGKKYETLNFYFERLTGEDVIAIENEMQANNEYALDPLLSRSFQSKMASRAGGIGSDIIKAMPIREFNRITTAARNFLIDTGY